MSAAAAGGTSPGVRRTSQVVKELENLTQILKQKQNHVGEKLPWIKTVKGNIFFGIVILANGLFIGVDIQWVDGFHYGFWAVESLFLLIFLVEIVLRLHSEKPYYSRFFDMWGVADVVLTIMGMADTWVITPILFFGKAKDAENPIGHFTVFRMIRLLRLVRLVRVLRKFNDLLVLVKTIRNSVKAVGWMSVLLGMLIYTGSVLVVLLLGIPYRDSNADIDSHFGSLGSSLFSHFLVVTLELWPQVATAAMQANRWWVVYFVLIITFGNCALVNVMVGIIVEQVLRLSWEQQLRRASFNTAVNQLRHTMLMLFTLADMDSSGDLGKEELRQMLGDPRAREVMLAFGMNMHIPMHMLFTIVDLNGDGLLTFPEFFDACMRLSGSTENLHGVFVQHDVCKCREVLKQTFLKLEEEITAVLPPKKSTSSWRALSTTTQVHGLLRAGRDSLDGDETLQAVSPTRSPSSRRTGSKSRLTVAEEDEEEEKKQAVSPTRSPSARRTASKSRLRVAEEDEEEETQAEIDGLRDRLDRFAEKQQLMQAELRALKERWQRPDQVASPDVPFDDGLGKQNSGSDSTTGDGTASVYEASSFGASPRPLPAIMPPASPLAAAVKAASTPKRLLHTFGREIGLRVMDSVFGDPPRRPHSAEPWARRRPGGLRDATRRQLQAEFAEKKAAEARRHS